MNNYFSELNEWGALYFTIGFSGLVVFIVQSIILRNEGAKEALSLKSILGGALTAILFGAIGIAGEEFLSESLSSWGVLVVSLILAYLTMWMIVRLQKKSN